MILLFLCCMGCSTQKHLEQHVETEKIMATTQALDVNEVTDKNTTKFIVITEYREVRDTVTGEYPVKSITEITEVNNDKIVTETKAETNQTVEEQTVEDKKEDVKKESNMKWYIVCFCAGFVFAILLWLGLKCLKLYLTKGV